MSSDSAVSNHGRVSPARVLGLILLVGGLWWAGREGYRGWVARKSEGFKLSCRNRSESADWPGLEAESRRWLEWDPEAPDAWLYFADARLQQNDAGAAVDALHRVPDSSPKAIPALLMASELQLGAANRPLDVVPTLDRLLELSPRSTTGRQRLIFFYAVTLQHEKMLAAIRDAISARSEPPEVYVYVVIASDLRLTNGFTLTERWIQSDPENELLIVARAVQYALLMDNLESRDREPREQVRERRQRMREFLARYPHNAALLRYHLHLAVSDDDVDRVGQLLSQVNEQTGDDSIIWKYRGWYHARYDALDEAERAYRRSLELDRMDWRTWHELAGVLRRRGRLDEAEQNERVSLEGKDLEKDLVHLPDAAAVSTPLLARIRDYASHCGDDLIVRGIGWRLLQHQSPARAEEVP